MTSAINYMSGDKHDYGICWCLMLETPIFNTKLSAATFTQYGCAFIPQIDVFDTKQSEILQGECFQAVSSHAQLLHGG